MYTYRYTQTSTYIHTLAIQIKPHEFSQVRMNLLEVLKLKKFMSKRLSPFKDYISSFFKKSIFIIFLIVCV